MKQPFWAKREFRWLLVVGILAVAVLLVLVFEIQPLFRGEPPGQALRPVEKPSSLPADPQLAAALEGVRDATEISETGPGYRALLDYLTGLSPEALGGAARRVDYAFFSKISPDLRGTPVTVTGLLLDWKPIALDEKVGATDVIYRAYLVDASGEEGYVVDLLEAPPRWEERTLVTVQGLYLKLGRYESQKGLVQAPVLLGRKLELALRRYEPSTFQAKAVLTGMVILAGALIVLTVWIYRMAYARRRPPLRLRERGIGTSGEEWKRGAPPGGPPSNGGWNAPWSAPAPPRLTAAVPRGWARPARKAAPPGAGRGELSDLTRRQGRLLGLFTAASGIVLLALIGYAVHQRLSPGRVEIDFSTAISQAFAAGAAARAEIETVEEKLAAEGALAQPQDREVIRRGLEALEDNAERMQDIFAAARSARLEVEPRQLQEASARLLEVKAWVLDARDVLEGLAADAPWSGFYIPFRVAARRWREAAVPAEAPEPAGQAAPGTVKRAKEALGRLEEAKASFTALEAYLKEGLAREDLTPEELPALARLREEAALVEREIAKAKKLAGEEGRILETKETDSRDEL